MNQYITSKDIKRIFNGQLVILLSINFGIQWKISKLFGL